MDMLQSSNNFVGSFIMYQLHYDKVFIQPIPFNFPGKNIKVSLLRLDRLHPVVSGNKWFKLQHYLSTARDRQFNAIATFGGAYSNHIVATAFACREMNLRCTGFIRGEEPGLYSPALLQAKEYGMDLTFISRNDFRNKNLIKEKYRQQNCYWINEGGFGIEGAEGIRDMYQWIDNSYTHILCAVGTGTMIAGLIKGAAEHQKITGINVLKGNTSIQSEIESLLTDDEKKKKYEIINDYHFGGYAKHPEELICFMRKLWQLYRLPTDIVYTSKLVYGVFCLLQKKRFPPECKIMVLHSGGLQGNLSLPKATLPF